MSFEPRREQALRSSTVRHGYRERLRNAKGAGNVIAIVDQGIVSAVNLAAVVVVGRGSGPSELGKYALGFSILLLAVAVLDALVVGPYIIRVHQLQGRLARYTGSMLLHTSGLGIIAAIGLLTMGYLGTSFMATSEVAHVLFPTAAIIAPALMREVARRLAFVDNRPAVALALDSCVAVLQLAGLAILAYTSTLTSTLALIVSGLACAVCSCAFFALRRHDFAFASRDALRDFLDNIGLGKWLLASQCTMIAQFTSVQWLAAFALGTEQTGELAACMSVVMVVNPFLTGIGNLLLPRASSIYARESGPGLARVLNGTTAVIAVGMAAFLLGIVLWGSRAFSIVYGARYANAHQVLVILAVGLAFRGGGMAAYLGLWVTGGARGNVLTSLLALGTTIGISLLCVRGLGLIGLAYGMLAGESSAAIVRWILLRRLLNAKLILIPVAT